MSEELGKVKKQETFWMEGEASSGTKPPKKEAALSVI